MVTTAVLPSVLLIEDDEGDALLVRECLREAGVPDNQVIWRRTVAEGVGALVHAPGCVLLDLGLPDAAGLEALHRVVSAATATPVIVLTGRNDRTGLEAVAAGAQDYVVKDDVTTELLDRSIRYAVQRHRAQSTELQLREEQLLSVQNARLERGLLPKPLLRTGVVTCRSHYQAGRNRAVLGGDFFDVVETVDGVVRIVIGDVMGHGPDEAALGVLMRGAWRGLALAGVPDHLVLGTLSQLLFAESGGGTFVTLCDATVTPDLRVTLRVAGHPPPLVCRGGAASYLDVSVGPPLGVGRPAWMDERWRESGGWPITRDQLEPGASLVLYTDGLLDAYRDPGDRTSLGLDELLAAMRSTVAADAPRAEWIPQLVGRAPMTSTDDTAVVMLTLEDGPT